MAVVTFKPVCECGYIFKHFEYDYNPKPPIKVYAADAEEGDIHKEHYIHQSAISPERCPKCGRLIKAFKIPDTRGIKLIYNEEEKK